MCDMCEGMSLDDIIERDAELIRKHGFTMVGVTANGDDPHDPINWIYTVGLLDTAAHPELVIAGAPLSVGASLMSAFARAVLDGERFLVGDRIDLGGEFGDARVGAVDEIQYRLDTFNMWHNLQAADVLQTDKLEVVQVVLPAELCPFGEVSWQPDLSDPEVRIGDG